MKFIVLCGLLLLFNCQNHIESKITPYKGHWHLIGDPFYCGDYVRTIDVSDSVLFFNKFEPHSFFWPAFFNPDSLALSDGNCKDSKSFFIKNDTLTVVSDSPTKWIRRNLAECEMEHRYEYILLRVSLPLNPSSQQLLEEVKFPYSSIFISNKLKREYESSYEVARDSAFVEVNGVLIEINEIARWIKNEAQLFEGVPFSLVLHVDKNVSSDFVKKITDKISREVILYLAFNSGGRMVISSYRKAEKN